MTDNDILIPIGKITSTHGIKGFVKVHSFSGNIGNLSGVKDITIRFANGTTGQYRLKSLSANSSKLLVSFEGLNDIDMVKPIIGSEICIYRSQFAAPAEDEYYWCDLMGLHVSTIDGVELGTVADIFETGSSDVYVVKGNGREYLIPAIADVISNIDLEKGTILITPLEGLLDL